MKKLIEGLMIYLKRDVPGDLTRFSPMTHAIALLSERNLPVEDTPSLKDGVLQVLKKFSPNNFLSAGIMGHASATLSNIFSSEFLYDILSVDFLSRVEQFFTQLGKHRNIQAAAQVLHLLSLLLTAQIIAKNHGHFPVPQLDLTVAANSSLVSFVNSFQAYDGVLPTHIREDIGKICSGLDIICIVGRDFATEDGQANKYCGTPTPISTRIAESNHVTTIPMKQLKDYRDSSARQQRLLQDKEKEIASLQAKMLMNQKNGMGDEERDATAEDITAIKKEIQELRKPLQTNSAPTPPSISETRKQFAPRVYPKKLVFSEVVSFLIRLPIHSVVELFISISQHAGSVDFKNRVDANQGFSFMALHCGLHSPGVIFRFCDNLCILI